jgi:phage shock protein A
MSDRLHALESAIEDLRASVRQLETRIAELEGRAPALSAITSQTSP